MSFVAGSALASHEKFELTSETARRIAEIKRVPKMLVVIANKRIAPGEILSRDSLRTEIQEKSIANKDVYGFPRYVVGRIASREIALNHPIHTLDLQQQNFTDLQRTPEIECYIPLSTFEKLQIAARKTGLSEENLATILFEKKMSELQKAKAWNPRK